MQLDRRGGIECVVHTVIAAVSYLIFVVFIGMAIALLFLFAAGPSLSQSQTIKIPQACAKLAALFGATVPEHFSRIEAEAALSHMNVRMILVPEARHCRAAIQKELKK